MAYVSNLPAIRAKLTRAIDAGLVAAVATPMDRTVKDLATGYTSGDFTTGESAAAVRRVEPFAKDGGRAIAYGTDRLPDLFWAIGGYSSYTRQFERVDKWTPHFYGSRAEMAASFSASWRQVMGW